MARGRDSEKARFREIAWQCRVGLKRLAAAAATAIFVAGPAGAIEVDVRKMAPRITMQIPDGWVATYTSVGLELQPPEKNSLIVAGVVAHEEKAVGAWAKLARKRMIELGAIFDPSEPMRVLTMKREAAKGLTNDPSGKSFSFSGPPLLKRMPGMDAPTEGFKSAHVVMNPFEVVQTKGAKLGGKPVDTEISYYALPKGQLLAVEQQSGPTDGRAVAIIDSLEMLP